MKIRGKNPKKEFSRSALLTALAEDLAFENKVLIGLLKQYNDIIEFEMGKDIEQDFPDLWKDTGNAAVEIAKRRENRIYDLL